MDSRDDLQPTADSTPSSSLSTPASGAPIDLPARYEVLNELGRGGMGMVYKARDRETGEIVALKVLLPEIAANETAMERFINELRLARKITHKNVCRIHEFHRSGETACIAMEYVGGDSLRAIFQRTGLSLRKAMDATRQICAGLREAHAQEVVHRDLKPENVMLDRAGVVKIMDFGVARSATGASTLTGALIGTPAYMSPEQASGKTVDHRSDIYSLGLILYEMFTGSVAFNGETPVEVALKQVQEAPARPREKEPLLPSRLEKVILRCLEKDPGKRYQTVDELETALTAPDEAEAPTPAAAEQKEIVLPLRLTRWHRWDYALLAAAVTGMAVFLFLFDIVYPYSAITPGTSLNYARQKAEAIYRRFDPSVSLSPGRPFVSGPIEYQYDVLTYGLLETNRIWNQRAGRWIFAVDPNDSRKGGLGIDRNGQVNDLSVPSAAVASFREPFPAEKVVPQAVILARDLFGVDVGSVAPVAKNWAVNWELPEEGRSRWVMFRFSPKGLVSAWTFQREKRSPQQEEVRRSRRESASIGVQKARSMGPAVVFGVLVLLFYIFLALFFMRRFYQNTSPSVLWAAAWASLAFTGLAGQHLEEKLNIPWWFSAIIALLLAYVFFRLPEHYLAASLPVQAGTWVSLPKQRGRAQASGLSLWRGCAWGACYLAVHTALILVLGETRLAALDILWLSQLTTLPRVMMPTAVCLAVLTTLVAGWFFLVMPMVITHRVRPGKAVALAAPALLWLLTAWPLLGTGAGPLLPLFLLAGLQGLFFAWLLWQFDFLTAMAAIFTVQTWMLAYPAYLIYYKVDWPGAASGMLPWFVMLLAGLTLYFRRDLGDAGRRLVAIFQ